MSALTIKLIQVGFLVLLWVLVLSVAAVMRSDLFARRRGRAPRPTKQAKQAKQAKAATAAATAGGAALAARPTAAAGATGAGSAATGTVIAPVPVPGKPPKQPKPSRPPKPRRGAPRELVVTSGTGQGTHIELGAEPVTIGRAPENTLVIDDDYVSGRHARFFPHEGAWVVEDLGSTNGTYLDRTRLTTPMVVPTGAPVRIGKTVVELRK